MRKRHGNLRKSSKHVLFAKYSTRARSVYTNRKSILLARFKVPQLRQCGLNNRTARVLGKRREVEESEQKKRKREKVASNTARQNNDEATHDLMERTKERKKERKKIKNEKMKRGRT